MNTNNRIWIYQLIMGASFSLILNSCNKEADQSSVIIFNPDLTYGTVTDIDGNVYKTITIGSQIWMAENLKTTKYRNGDSIETTTPSTLNISRENTPKYQWAYDGNESNVAIYGRLYTWYVVTDSRNVCPTGWHLPSNDEWHILALTFGPASPYYGNESEIAGGKLKETGTTHWVNPNKGATNESGFTALPGGDRNQFGIFQYIREYGNWWSSSENSTEYAYNESMGFSFSALIRWYSDKKNDFSVRCLKDN